MEKLAASHMTLSSPCFCPLVGPTIIRVTALLTVPLCRYNTIPFLFTLVRSELLLLVTDTKNKQILD